MKLNIFKGLAHDLAHNLELSIYSGTHKLFIKSFPVNINALDQKTLLHKHCYNFFRERLPKTFDFSRIKEIRIKIVKPVSPGLSVSVKIKVDDREFKSQLKSMWS